MINFDYARPSTQKAAIDALNKDATSQFIAGGTNLVDLMKRGVTAPQKLIDINNLPLKNIQKIAVFRALQLGDMLCAMPALRALRSSYPDAEITLIGLPWAKSIVERFSDYIDRFISFPGYPGLPEQPFDEEEFEFFLKKTRKEKFDLLLQMQGNGTIVNELLSQFGASNLVGFYNDESYMDSPLFMR